MHMDCCYGNQLLHPHPFSLRLFYTIIRSHTHYNNNNNYYNTNNCAFVVTDIFIIIIVGNQVASVYQKILVGFKVLVLQISYLNNNIKFNITIIILSDDYII